MNKELKNCPFCGGEAELEAEREYIPNPITKLCRYRAYVVCQMCGARVGQNGTVGVADKVVNSAIEAWNRRAADE